MSESGGRMAVVATRAVEDDPLAGLAVVEASVPVPRAGEMIVEIEAAALNHHDLWTLRGIGAVVHTFPLVLGSDGAGHGKVLYPLIPCGDFEHCHGCRVGNASLCRRLTLLGEGRDGTMAPQVALPAAHVLDAPANLTPAEAACLPSAWLTAWSMLRDAGVSEGTTVLVTGATGGVGVAAVQLGSALGARMVAQVRRSGVADALEVLGAERVAGIEDDAKTVLGGEFDVVLESLGRRTWAQSLRALRPGGTVVVTGATSGADPPADLRRIFWRRLRIVGVSLGSLREMQDLIRFVEARNIHPAIAAVYSARDAAEAFAHLLRGSVLGKIVLEF